MKKTWQIIKNIISKNKSSVVTDTFIINGRKITDPDEIVSKFNDFFVNIGPSFAKKYSLVILIINSLCTATILILLLYFLQPHKK